MSIVTVQIGQCGNQVGSSLFTTLGEECAASSSVRDYHQDALETFFRPRDSKSSANHPSSSSSSAPSPSTHHARCVLIDMEPKVVQSSIRRAHRAGSWWTYDARASFSRQSGSGNNWAAGYCTHAPQNLPTMMDLVRREIERCDFLGGLLLLQSMAGGTGSGLGTRVSEALRDEYPSTFLFNQCIWPYASGEVIVQSYNTILTLAHLSNVSDGILLVENEALHRTCVKSLGLARPSFDEMNAVVARSLASSLLPARHRPTGLPTDTSQDGSGARGKEHHPSASSSAAAASSSLVTPPPPLTTASTRPVRLFRDLIMTCCAHPGFKILNSRSIPQMPSRSVDYTTFRWDAILKRLRQMLMTGAVSEDTLNWYMQPGRKGMQKTLGAMLTLRGAGAAAADARLFTDPWLYASWAADPIRTSYAPVSFARYEMYASLVSNDQSCVRYIEPVVKSAEEMFSARAYVHQYEREGLEAATMEEASMRVEEIVWRYRGLQ